MALDLSLLPKKPKGFTFKKKDEEEDESGVKPAKPVAPPEESEGLDLSILPKRPGVPSEEDETEPLNVRDLVKPVAKKATEMVRKVPGSNIIDQISELYSTKAAPLKPITKSMDLARDVVVKAGGVFDLRRPSFLAEQNLRAPNAKPRVLTPEQEEWEKDINALVESEALELAKNLAAKRHPDLAAAQRGQETLQILSDLGLIAVSGGATSLVTKSVTQLPKIAKAVSQVPRLARMLEAGAVAVPYTTLKSMPKGDETVTEAFKDYPTEVAQNVVGFMAFSAGAQLAGAAFDRVAFQKVVEKLPVKSMTLTKDKVRDYYAISGTNPEVREFAKAVPGFKELARKTFETGEESVIVIPEKTMTRIAARPWYQKLRQTLVSDASPIPERTLFTGGGEPVIQPRASKALPAPGETMPRAGVTPGGTPTPAASEPILDLNVLPKKPANLKPLVPATTEEGAPVVRNAYDVLAKENPKLSEAFNFPKDSRVEEFRTRTHKGESVYTPEELEAEIKRDYVTKDLNLFKKDFVENVRRKADDKPLAETPTLFMDFDNLKGLNTKLGRSQANQLFQGFSHLLNEHGYTAFRWGGDEFGITLNPVKKGKTNPVEMMEDLNSLMTELSNLEVRDKETGEVIHKGLSISGGFGMSMEKADAAAEVAKKAGKGQIVLDKKFLEDYNQSEGTSYEWKASGTTISARPGEAVSKPKEISRSLAERTAPGTPQLPTTGRPAQPVKPEKKLDPTAKQTPLSEEAVPQVKTEAGGLTKQPFDVHKEITPNIETSFRTVSDLFQKAGLRREYVPILETKVRVVDDVGEGKADGQFIESSNTILIKKGLSKERFNQVLEHEMTHALESKASGKTSEEGVKKALDSGVLPEPSIDLNLLPNKPDIEAPAAAQIPAKIQARLETLSQARAKQAGLEYADVLDKATTAYRQVIQEKGEAEATKLLEATERSVNIKPKAAKKKKMTVSSSGGGGGAAMAAPSSAPSTKPEKPKGGDEGEQPKELSDEPPKNPVWPGAPNDFVPHIEMPELVRLARQLLGDMPAVKKLRHAMGYFKGARGEKLGGISLDRSIFKDPVEATKILAHEIGHLIDWLPNYTLSRGNILGRLKVLVEYRKTLIDPLPTANDALDPIDRRKIQNKAIKEALSHTQYTMADYIKKKEVRAAMKTMIKETYDDMVADEIKKKGLITKEGVSKELKAVTQYWHPFDPDKDARYTAYRFSSRELYAEALSMLFNEPIRLKEMAPTFYKAFWDNLEKKPEVQFNLLELDELLGTEQGRKQILEQRSVDLRDGYRKGEDIWFEKRRERSIKKRNLWLTLKDEIVDRNSALIEKVTALRKQGKKLNPEDNPIYYLEEYNYLGGKIHNLLEDISKDVLEDSSRLGISQEDIGEYLFLRRVTTERTDIANPLGQNRMTAQKSLEHLLSKFNPLERAELEKSVKNLTKYVQKLNKEAYQAGLYSDETYNKIATNDAYATFQVLDYLQDYVSAAVIHQVGTFKEIANPLTSTVMKLISVKRAVEREKTRKSVVNFMRENFEKEIQEAEYKFIGMKGDMPIREPREKEGQGIIVIHQGGKSQHFYVDPYIADTVNYAPQKFNSAVVRAIKFVNTNWFRPVYISLNLGFQTFNTIKDFVRGWKLNPDTTLAGHIFEYFRNSPAAASRVWGPKADPIVRQMRETGMASITYNDMFKGEDQEESQIEAIMRKFGVGPQQKEKTRNPFVATMDLISDMGNFVETLPKVVGARTRMKAGKLSMREIAHEVRVYSGSPDFLRKGRSYSWSNEIFLFSNAIKEGLRGDVEGAFSNPRTRGGYWWKTAATGILPKLIMFFGAAGFMGKEIKDNYDRQTEYDKTSYITVPLGMTDNNQAVYLRIPQDEVGRLISSLFWKMLKTNEGELLDAAVQVAGLTAGQIPSQSPVLDIAQTVTEYMIGRNPYDWFRGRQILTDDEQRVRGWTGARKMGRWVLSKLGFSVSWGYFDKEGDSTVVKMLRYTPVVSRFFKITDYGLEEKRREHKRKKIKRVAEKRIRRSDVRSNFQEANR